MARPRNFEIDEVLDKAMDAFMRHGFGGTPLPELLDAMGIARGSFYKAFEDKRSVYLAALERYDALVVVPAVARLIEGKADGAARIAAFLHSAATGEAYEASGCFLCNAAVDRAPFDREVKRLIAGMMDRLEDAFRQAVADAECCRSLAPAQQGELASALLSVYVGIRLRARSGTSKTRLAETVAGALRMLQIER